MRLRLSIEMRSHKGMRDDYEDRGMRTELRDTRMRNKTGMRYEQ